ncbi:MAG: aspartate carbamoyltransferase regulatory subunit [Thermoprotei archaeon]|nr:MAG: aspartate carbamoyltransferase regulatory subunit [Thermoprotei archaeon]
MDEKKLLVSKIRDGTVIDHIPAGKALEVLRILGLTGKEGYRIALVMNVDSGKLGRKDIVKIEEKWLSRKEVDLIALIAPTATINIVKDYRVVSKYKVSIPDEIVDAIKCPNPTCISRRSGEVARSRFILRSRDPVLLECYYCGTVVRGDEVEKYVTA